MILLVDDDEDVREIMADALASRGYAVRAVSNGAAGLAAIERERPCLVFLDLLMPVMDGWTFLRELHARSVDVPVCVISAFADQGFPSGATTRLGKPFELAELLAVASRYCPHHASDDAHVAGA